MSSPYEYSDARIQLGVDNAPDGVRLRVATTDGAIGVVVALSPVLTERLTMALSSALTRRRPPSGGQPGGDDTVRT